MTRFRKTGAIFHSSPPLQRRRGGGKKSENEVTIWGIDKSQKAM